MNEAKQSEANIYLSGMSELNARIEASIVFLKPVYSTPVVLGFRLNLPSFFETL
jgi:hypothetical protein